MSDHSHSSSVHGNDRDPREEHYLIDKEKCWKKNTKRKDKEIIEIRDMFKLMRNQNKGKSKREEGSSHRRNYSHDPQS